MTVIVKLDIKGKQGVSAIYVDLVNTEKCSGKLTSTAFFTTTNVFKALQNKMHFSNDISFWRSTPGRFVTTSDAYFYLKCSLSILSPLAVGEIRKTNMKTQEKISPDI